MIERSLLYLPCRHHIFELILRAVFESIVPNTSGPNVPLFGKLKKEWNTLDKSKYKSGIADPTIYKILKDDISDLREFLYFNLSMNQDRDDYVDFLKTALIFLGESPDGDVIFRAPGAMHHARWMAKAIYCLKIYIFRDVFILPNKLSTEIGKICIFIVKFYIKVWFKASSSNSAPNCDFNILKDLYHYQNIDKKISEVALQKFLNHLWYLNPENCMLAFFDKNVPVDTKRKMIASIKQNALCIDDDEYLEEIKKVKMSISEIPYKIDDGLEQFVSKNSLNFFKKLDLKIDWLELDPDRWLESENYLQCMEVVSNLSVVNDIAERGVKLMEEYNCLFTKDEQQKQFIIKIVDDYRKTFPQSTKECLTSVIKF